MCVTHQVLSDQMNNMQNITFPFGLHHAYVKLCMRHHSTVRHRIRAGLGMRLPLQ